MGEAGWVVYSVPIPKLWPEQKIVCPQSDTSIYLKKTPYFTIQEVLVHPGFTATFVEGSCCQWASFEDRRMPVIISYASSCDLRVPCASRWVKVDVKPRQITPWVLIFHCPKMFLHGYGLVLAPKSTSLVQSNLEWHRQIWWWIHYVSWFNQTYSKKKNEHIFVTFKNSHISHMGLKIAHPIPSYSIPCSITIFPSKVAIYWRCIDFQTLPDLTRPPRSLRPNVVDPPDLEVVI